MGFRGRAAIAAGTVALGLLVVGCTPAGGGTPTPQPTSPQPTHTPSEDSLERQRRQDFETAEKAFRTFEAERGRLLRAGGADGATAILKATSAGPLLKETENLVRAFKSTGSREVGMEAIPYVNKGGYSPTELLIDSCIDGRKVKTYLGKKSLGSGEIQRVFLTVRKLSGVWKLWSVESEERDTCAV